MGGLTVSLRRPSKMDFHLYDRLASGRKGTVRAVQHRLAEGPGGSAQRRGADLIQRPGTSSLASADQSVNAN